MMQTSYCRALVSTRGNTAILKLTSHTRAAADRASLPVKAQHVLPPGNEHIDAFPHQPTPAECYGCVDWFWY